MDYSQKNPGLKMLDSGIKKPAPGIPGTVLLRAVFKIPAKPDFPRKIQAANSPGCYTNACFSFIMKVVFRRK